jgi:glutamyl-tRNA synthetase/glutamyl-Q tRNA(Asp) synthetase
VEPVANDLPIALSIHHTPVTRFAPAPTGFLHLGHLVNAVYVWGLARRYHGQVLLRIEDHDRGRSRDHFESAILDDLEWLGLEPDAPPIEALRQGPSPYRQSDRATRYAEVLAGLRHRELVYPCCCSRRDIAADVTAVPGSETRYPGTCRECRPDPDEAAGLRLIMEPGEETFIDVLLGTQRQEPAHQCGDVLMRDRLGQWTYQFAVTVDDWDQGIDLVIRGEDLLSSTGRQIRLARMIGRPDQITFLHHPLVLKPSGEKLSKANRDTGLAELRQAGVTPETLLGEAAFRGGLLEEARPLEVAELPGLFG